MITDPTGRNIIHSGRSYGKENLALILSYSASALETNDFFEFIDGKNVENNFDNNIYYKLDRMLNKTGKVNLIDNIDLLKHLSYLYLIEEKK